MRNIRKDNGISNREKLQLKLHRSEGYPERIKTSVEHLTNLDTTTDVDDKVEGAYGFMVGRHRFYIPFGDSFDVDAEKVKIQKDLEYQEGFLNIVRKKLSNERFMIGAPEKVIEIEKNKEQDALAKIAILKEKLSDLC